MDHVVRGRSASTMKIIRSILTCCLALVTLGCTKCKENPESTESSGRFGSADSIAKQNGKQFMDYLIDGDAESIKNMFCQRTLQLADFDEQFQTAMDFIDGNIVSYGEIGSGGAGEYTRNGKITVMDVTPYIENIVTNTGKTYEIILYMFIYFEGHDDVIGITALGIRSIKNVQAGYGNSEEIEIRSVGEVIHKVDVW